MPASIRGQFSERLKSEIEKDWAYIHQKKRRLGILSHKLKALDTTKQASLCFGGQAYFRHQFHLDKTEIGSHEEWLEGFRQRRSSQAFFVGSSDETAGNQTVQYDVDKKSLKLRLPNATEFEALGTHLIFESLTFPEHLCDVFYATLGKPRAEARKNQKTAGPISYRFMRRVNPNTKEKAYYIQASFGVPEAEKVTKLTRGAIGVDLNADHVAVTETDPYGNYLDSFILPFDLKHLSREQAKAIIGDLSAVIAEHAVKTGKALSIEELDFEEKKKALREQPKERRTFLSGFAYSHFQKAIRSKSRAMGVELISINPAFTSLIGAYKYQGLQISSHEKAALAIARRAQGYSEGLKVFQGTLPTQVMMSERTLFEEGSRHVWGFYGDHRQKIRSLLIETDKRPLLPLLRAISLARVHPSLYQSLIVTREKRVEEALRRASA
jgi:IS605 OrfB family transposase